MEIVNNRKAVRTLLERREYVETQIARRFPLRSCRAENERTAIDYAIAALNFVIQTLEYEASS
jgi:hypothetical protein